MGEVLIRYVMELLVKLSQPTKIKDLPPIQGKLIFDVDAAAVDPEIKVEWITLTLLDISTTQNNENKKS